MGIQELAVAIGVIIVVLVLFGWAALALVAHYYIKAPADIAFVRTGGSKPKVVLNGGSWVFPAFHKITWVSLRTMDIDVERTADNALLTIDPQYADIRAIFFTKVNPIQEDIERAARTIGGYEVNAESVKRLVESKLEGALRDVAATFTLMSLHQEREKFVERVQNLVRSDLAENGLVLEAVSITALKSARQGSFGIDDVFGAQVARANAEVIQDALKRRNEIDQTTQTEVSKRNATAEQERNDIERNKELEVARRNAQSRREQNDIERHAELEITRRNAEVDQEKLSLERNVSQARATQQREILIKESEERSAAEKVAYEQQQSAELARVIKERTVAEAEKEKEQAIQLAEQRKQQVTQLAEKERLAISADREAASQQVITVQEKAEAEREAQIQLINAERDAKREMINRRNTVEIEAIKQVKEAEAEADALNRRATAEATAAIQMAEARRTEAHAHSDAEKMRAEAAKATAAASGLAEADVMRAKAQASEQEAVAIRARGLAEAESVRALALANAEGQRAMADALAANEGVSQHLELERIRLQAQIEVGVAQAHAMGEALASMDFKLYGTPETANQLLRMVGMADGVSSLLGAAPPQLKELGNRMLGQLLPNGNGNGTSSHAPLSQPDLAAAQPLIAAGAEVLHSMFSPAELAKLSLRQALEQAQLLASTSQQATLLQLQGMLVLLPQLADLPVTQLLPTA